MSIKQLPYTWPFCRCWTSKLACCWTSSFWADFMWRHLHTQPLHEADQLTEAGHHPMVPPLLHTTCCLPCLTKLMLSPLADLISPLRGWQATGHSSSIACMHACIHEGNQRSCRGVGSMRGATSFKPLVSNAQWPTQEKMTGRYVYHSLVWEHNY